MNEPFLFRKVLYLVEATRYRARNLDQLLRAVTVVDPSSIGYHMHREYLEFRFVEPEWPNDFAYWTARVLGDPVLAEKLAALRMFHYRTLEALKHDLGRTLAYHMEEFPASTQQLAPPQRDFMFSRARVIVMDCKRQARTLSELMVALAEVEASSIYYHLFEARFYDVEKRLNDFAVWARESLSLPDLADKLTAFDPYMFSLEGARRALLRIVGSAVSAGVG